MSDVSVDIIKNRSGEAPDLPSGANLSGVSTAATLQVTNLNPTHINASGVTTATTFSGGSKCCCYCCSLGAGEAQEKSSRGLGGAQERPWIRQLGVPSASQDEFLCVFERAGARLHAHADTCGSPLG